YLAEHPLGTRTQMSNAEVGKMLNQLPRRAAAIRNGQDTGIIYTHDTPPRLPEQAYRQRVTDIRNHTRKTYCRPRNEVERDLLGTPAAPPPVAPPVPDISQADTQPLPAVPASPTVQPVLSGWEEAE